MRYEKSGKQHVCGAYKQMMYTSVQFIFCFFCLDMQVGQYHGATQMLQGLNPRNMMTAI